MLHVHMVSGVMWLLATHSVLMNSTVLMLKWDHLTSRLQELHKWRCIANLCWSQFQPLPLMRLVFILVSRFVIGQTGGSAGCVTAIMKQKHAQPLWWFSEGLWGITILLQWIFLNKTIYFLSNSVFFYCYVILHVQFHGWPMCNIFFVRFCVCVCGYGLGNWFEQDWSEESLYDKVPSSQLLGGDSQGCLVYPICIIFDGHDDLSHCCFSVVRDCEALSS